MEKKRKYTFDFHQRWEKMLLILRTAFLMVLITTINFEANASAQIIKVSVRMENATIDEMIKNVRIGTNYRFLYRVEEVNKYGKRDINLQNVSIEEFLRVALEGTKLSYEIEDDVIIIHPSKDDNKKTVEPRKVTGTVMDMQGNTLPGSTILIQGTSLGVVTDVNGKFTLEIPQMDSVVLVVSFVGYETRYVALGNEQKELTIKLKEDVTEMDEVVVTGYGKVRKESFTGSSVSVSKEQLMKVSKTNVLKALQAFDPSFRIQTNNQWGSDPNALPEMYIRGRSGVGVKQLDPNYTSKGNLQNNPNLPTFIMDGFEISVQKLYDMDPSRIANITILKDAAATALYGSRAANGVVIITTVAPKPGKLNISYGLTGEVTMPDLSAYNLMNAKEKLETEVLAGAFEPYQSDVAITLEKRYNAKLNNVVKGIDTYWLSLPLQTAFNHKHSLFVEGGSENLRFGVDLSYYNEDGVMKESFRDRLGAGVTLDYHLKNLQVKNQTTYNITKSKETPYGSFSNYANALPYNVYKDENGRYLEEVESWGESGTFPNPMYEASLNNFDKSQTEEFINNLSINWNINPYLLLKGQFSLTRQFSNSRRFLDPLSKQNTNPISDYNTTSGELHTTDGNNFNWDMQATLSYNRTINKHNLNFLVGINQRATKTESVSAQYRGFPNGTLNSQNYAEEVYEKPRSSENSTRLVGFLGTLNYSYNNIYLLDASVRMDGSSEFGSDSAEPLRQGAYQLPHLLDARRVQAVCGLVQDEQLGVAQQGRRKAQALLHAQGVVGHLLPPLAVQPDDLQHLPDVLLRRAAERLDDPQVLLAREVAVIAGALDEAPHLPEHGQAVFGVHLLPQHLDAPRRGAHQAQDHFQRGGLSRPVGAEEPVDAALRHVQVQVRHPQGVSILFAQVVRLDDVHGKTSLRLQG